MSSVLFEESAGQDVEPVTLCLVSCPTPRLRSWHRSHVARLPHSQDAGSAVGSRDRSASRRAARSRGCDPCSGQGCEPGVAWNYSDKNTDALALLAKAVTRWPYTALLQDLFDDIGANDQGSLVVSPEGSASPCYGISRTTRDYAAFLQWIAQRRAPARTTYQRWTPRRITSEPRTRSVLG